MRFGQVTLRKEVSRHLGIGPGEKIELAKLPAGRVMLKAAHPAGKIDRFLGLLAGKAGRQSSILVAISPIV
jgi:bifunctional DNA-binding transcriptional regulator/antitoxin component of YhaV-PrlF toxin-antitoxin module